ncbi:MAG: sensor protein [Marmoricola sp.]|nr:sensor protein [Marmoricola sp.]
MGTHGGERGKGRESGPERARPRLKWGRVVAPVVALVVASASVTVALVSANGSNRQEGQLLSERASELASFLTVTLADTHSLLLVAENAASTPAGAKTFGAVTATATVGGTTTVAIVHRVASGFKVVLAAGGHAPARGSSLDPVAAAVAARAQVAHDMVAGVTTVAGAKHLILALAGALDPTQVALIDSVVAAATPAPTAAESPFRELNVAVYAGRVVAPGQEVLVSGSVPGAGSKVVVKQFQVGADTWSLAVAARTPLIGTQARAFPWLMAGAGVGMAIILGLLIETLIRRRAYALSLVAERTRLLQDAQRSAERANKAKSEFLSRMSHELRTPLNAVLGFAQLLEMDDLSPEQIDNVGQIAKGGSHLLDLINEILDISQIESGRLSLSPEPVLVSEVIDAAVALVRPLADERSIHLMAGTDDEPDCYVFADRQRLKQIMLNLLGNGIKYNRQGGSVSVSCVQPGSGVLRIQVTDTGPGIAPENRELLFAPFERLGAEQTLIEGTGVGLALSRGLAEAMGGRLDVDTTPGRGSTFWVELPVVESPLGVLARRDASDLDDVEDKMVVLHIEDNPANLALVERVLEQRPEVEVVPAMQGRIGVELARRYRPTLILLDLNLADLPGVDVLRELRADPTTATIPVVVISADAMPRQIQRLLSFGASAYLTKPIDIRELLKQVDGAVSAAREGGVTTSAAVGSPPGQPD